MNLSKRSWGSDIGLAGTVSTGRRKFVRDLAMSAGALAAISQGDLEAAAVGSLRQPTVREGSSVRDRLWMWGHFAGSFNGMYNLPGSSHMSPVEAALYLNLPNLVMLNFPSTEEFCKTSPVPSETLQLISCRPLKRVIWSIGNFGTDKRVRRAFVGRATARDVKNVWELAAQFPNVAGAQLDIFFRDALGGRRTSTFTLNELDYLRSQLRLAERKLDFWVTLYRRDLEYDPAPYLQKVDVVTFWNWRAEDLETLDDGFTKLEQAAPKGRKLLGCCLWDFEAGKPIPLSLMRRQCEAGLEWLRNGRIEGIVFRASTICDLNLEAVEWTRRWIREVADEEIRERIKG